MPEEERVRVTNDDGLLEAKRKHDDYVINRITKYAILILSLIVAVVITVVVLFAIITNKSWHDYAIKTVLQNVPGIIAVVLVVLGLRKK